MDFVAATAFLILYYIRPHEWIPGVGLLRPVLLVMALAIWGTFMRSQGFSWRTLFKTPHDGLMLALFGWIVLTAPSIFGALNGVYNVFVFYFVTVLALSSLSRLQTYTRIWGILILVIAGLAVASQYGFDPTESAYLTQALMKGRLALNTSIFANANALGHSVVPVVLIIYFALIWKRPLFTLLPAIALLSLPLYCIYLTESKGAYLCGAATATAALCLGRPKLVQLWILVGALTVGVAGLKSLPRMSDMQNAKSEAGIQGRLVAFSFGLEAMEKNLTGVGYEKFADSVERARRFRINSHSSYVHIGGEFGYPGLFLFCGLLYASYRTLFLARSLTVDEERVRAILYVLLVSFTISSWMIDWGTRAYYFLIIAAIAAFHRHLLEKATVIASPATLPLTSVRVTPKPRAFAKRLLPRVSLARTKAPSRDLKAGRRFAFANATLAVVKPLPIWNRISRWDLLLMVGITMVTASFWKYVMVNI